MIAPVETIEDTWGTAPPDLSAVLDSPSSQLSLSTFAPPPLNVPALDYDAVMAELGRLEARCHELKMKVVRCV